AVSKVSLLVTPRGVAVRGEIAMIEFQGKMKQAQSLVRLGRRIRMRVRHGTQVEVIRIEAIWPLAARTIDLGTADGGLDCSDDLRRQLVLQIEDVRDRTTKFARPDMACRLAVHELSVDANLIGGSPDAAFQKVANTQFLRDTAD